MFESSWASSGERSLLFGHLDRLLTCFKLLDPFGLEGFAFWAEGPSFCVQAWYGRRAFAAVSVSKWELSASITR